MANWLTVNGFLERKEREHVELVKDEEKIVDFLGKVRVLLVVCEIVEIWREVTVEKEGRASI